MVPHAATLHRGVCKRPRPFADARSAASRPRCRCRAGSQARQERSFDDSGAHLYSESGISRIQKLGAKLGSFGLAAALTLGLWAHPAPAVTNEQLLFLEAWRAVDRAYYDKNFNGKPWFKIREQFLKEKSLNDRQETYAAIRSLLAQLDDPFTRFLEPSRYAALKRGTAGTLTGVGLEVGFDKDAGTDSPLVVITPSPGGPADKAGIQPRDAVIAIDGKQTAGISLYDAGDLLQGSEGSQVTLSIQPHDGSEEREVQLQRQRLTVNPVSHQFCKRVPWGLPDAPNVAEADSSSSVADSNVGYIRVATFSKQTTEGVKAALHQLQSEGASRYVLDIRNNGGGLFPAGVDVARMLLNDGDIVLIADSQGVRDSYSAAGTAVEASAPLSVLVNKGTASASEVLAGALRDNGRGKIVGEPTFGKGLIQTIVELSDGSGVAVTVARYQTPDGTDINKKGIQPDILLSAGSMPPTSGPAFCKFVAKRGAAAFFDAEAAKAVAAQLAASPVEEQSEERPADTTLYENAMSGSAAEALPSDGSQPSSTSQPAQPVEERSSIPEGTSPVERGASDPQIESNDSSGEKATELVS